MKKNLLPSEAMLKGYAMAGGRQCVRKLHEGDGQFPTAVCAGGAILLAVNGHAGRFEGEGEQLCRKAYAAFKNATGFCFDDANNGDCLDQTEPMSIEDIAGILASEGA